MTVQADYIYIYTVYKYVQFCNETFWLNIYSTQIKSKMWKNLIRINSIIDSYFDLNRNADREESLIKWLFHGVCDVIIRMKTYVLLSCLSAEIRLKPTNFKVFDKMIKMHCSPSNRYRKELKHSEQLSIPFI